MTTDEKLNALIATVVENERTLFRYDDLKARIEASYPDLTPVQVQCVALKVEKLWPEVMAA